MVIEEGVSPGVCSKKGRMEKSKCTLSPIAAWEKAERESSHQRESNLWHMFQKWEESYSNLFPRAAQQTLNIYTWIRELRSLWEGKRSCPLGDPIGGSHIRLTKCLERWVRVTFLSIGSFMKRWNDRCLEKTLTGMKSTRSVFLWGRQLDCSRPRKKEYDDQYTPSKKMISIWRRSNKESSVMKRPKCVQWRVSGRC